MSRIDLSRLISAQRLNDLEARMEAYYSAVPDYPAFHTPSNHPLEWVHVLAEVINRSNSQSPVTILEFGSGRSGFPAWLRDHLASVGARTSLHITCQDVTATNRFHLQEVADEVIIATLDGGVLQPAGFDIIFSTHCFEHVARPEQLLHTLVKLLKPGGSILLFAPRYDLPFYLSPSAGDLSIFQHLLLSLKLMAIRFFSVLRDRPAFVIDTRPSCLDRPFRRDADAIHWVSLHDLRVFARRFGLVMTELDVTHHAPRLSKQWIIDQFSKLSIRLVKV